MNPLSIRWSFALWAAGLVGCVLTVFATFTLLNLYAEQIEAVDIELNADGKRVAELHPRSQVEETVTQMERFQPWMAFALFDAAGRLQSHSGRVPESLARAALAESRPHTSRDRQGSWRIETFLQEGEVLVVAYDLGEVHKIIHDLIVAYVLSLPFAVAIAGAGGWWISGRALVPVRSLTVAAERVQAQSLDYRIPVPPAVDEIQRLSIVLNAMLARLEKSFGQAQRFAADASHELRTPLTIMRGEIDQLVRAPGILPSHEEKLLSVQEEIDRLHRIAENLLLLARFDAGQAQFESKALDLTVLVQEACEDAELLAAGRDISIEIQLVAGVGVRGDRNHLRRAILNLLDNAVKFNRAGGQIKCEMATREGMAVLRVANTGPDISATQRAHLFQRFFRADPSRERKVGGHGLGLSLSREIAQAHGGQLELADASPGWTEFVLTLPSHGAFVELAGVPQ